MDFTSQEFYAIWNRQIKVLERIADALERSSPPVSAPNYELPLEIFADFDWSTLGATVDRSDKYGAAVVSWRGLQFVRRAPENKFGEAIWFSRAVGKGEQGQVLYERLVTFRPLAKIGVEPLPDKVTRLMNGAVR